MLRCLALIVVLLGCATGGSGEAGASGTTGSGDQGGLGGGGHGGAAGGGGGHAGAGGGAVCGNGVAELDEACDDRDFGGKTCETYGLGPGQLVCNAFCAVVVSNCAPP